DMPQQSWSVRISDDDGTPGTCTHLSPPRNCGWRLAVRDGNTDLVINKFEGIRYEIEVPGELPGWFVENNWQHFVHAAISGANLPATVSTSGDGACETPPLGAGNEDDDCLTVEYNAAMVRDDVEALVLGPGAALAALPQDRNAGTACAPQPAFLCDYFEAPNSADFSPAPRNLVFGRAMGDTFSVSNTFNDQIRTIPP
ncbi:MAG: hypothetical protein P8Y69_17620, partial [Gammaproteobacteria bacterium]